MMALQDTDRARGLDAFDQAFWGHVGHSIANTFRAWGRAWTGGLFAPAPDAGPATPYYRQLSRHTSAFALAVDLSLLRQGGGMKRQEMVSARFGDILSELYLSSAALKRWNDEGRQRDDLPLLNYCMEASFSVIVTRFEEIIANFPVRPVAWILRFLIQPITPLRLGPTDAVVAQCAELITNPCPSRDRLTVDLYQSKAGDTGGVAILDRAFAATVAVQPIRDRMHAAHVRDIDQAVKQRTITAEEAEKLKAAATAVAAAIAVDDFAPEELTSRGAAYKGDESSQATSRPRPAAAE
jgi:acyl-CoA dehydrogenase